MSDDQNKSPKESRDKRVDPKSNPFNRGGSDTLAQYDEFGNRINLSEVVSKTEVDQYNMQGNQEADKSIKGLMKNEMPIGVNTDKIREETPAETDESVSEVIKEDLSIASNYTKSSDDQKLPLVDSHLIQKMKSAKTIIAVLVIVVTAGVILLAGFVIQSDILSGAAQTNTSNRGFAEKVAEIVDIPGSERPSKIANIKDPQTLPEKNPFKNVAQKGDLILVYENSRLAILFRPTSGKVISIGQIIDNSAESVAGAATESATITPASAEDSFYNLE